MKQSLHDAWWRLATTSQPHTFSDALLGSTLQGGAVLYRLGVAARNGAYDRGWATPVRLSAPVISVGNLTVGGTGKTACVELLTNKIQRLGKRVAILSRGYGGRLKGPYALLRQSDALLLDGQPVPSDDGVADEPQLLAARLPGVPVLVGRRREQTGAQACERFQAQALILDDGFQYRRLHRDCDVVLINARMPLGGWALLPRGPMREPLSAVRRADILIITKADQTLSMLAAMQERLKAMHPEAIVATAAHEPSALADDITHEAVALERLVSRKVSALSSIGDPEGFEETLRRLGAALVGAARYPDHHRYQAREWAAIAQQAASSGAEALLTTEKDAIRLRPFWQSSAPPLPVWVLRVEMRLLSGEELVDARLARVCGR